jgi:hypothetical protein
MAQLMDAAVLGFITFALLLMLVVVDGFLNGGLDE